MTRNRANDRDHRASANVILVNAFAYQGKGGSPTGIMLEAESLTEEQMRSIAKQSIASHIVFISGEPLSFRDAKIRYFTAGGQLQNCGHGAIAAKWFLDRSATVCFRQNSITFSPCSPALVKQLTAALNITAADLGRDVPPIIASPGSNRFLVPLHSNETLWRLAPDLTRIEKICCQHHALGCFVYAIKKKKNEAEARMFAPAIGVPEDIINGNSAGALGVWRLLAGKSESPDHLKLNVFQGRSFGPPGCVQVIVRRGSNGIETHLCGTAFLSGSEQILY